MGSVSPAAVAACYTFGQEKQKWKRQQSTDGQTGNAPASKAIVTMTSSIFGGNNYAVTTTKAQRSAENSSSSAWKPDIFSAYWRGQSM